MNIESSLNAPGPGTVIDSSLDPTPPAGQDGLATYLRTIKSYTPLGTSADAANIQALMTAMAGVGEVRIKAGGALINTPLILKSQLTIVHHPNTTLTSTQTPGSDTAFIYNFENVHAGAGLLTSDAVIGAMTVVSDTTFSVDSWVHIGQTPGISEYQGAQYRVASVAGGGPYTLTLDRPVLFPFKTNDKIQLISSRLFDVQIIGNGCTFYDRDSAPHGVNRFLRVLGGFRIHVQDINLIAAGAAPHGISYDLGCLESSVKGISARGCEDAMILECCERFYVEQANAEDCVYGVLCEDSRNGVLANCSSSNGTTGISLQQNANGGTTPYGCYDVTVVGGLLTKMGTGMNFGRSDGCKLVGVASEDCDINFSISSLGARATFDSCISRRAAGATGVGYLVQGSGAKLLGCQSIGDARFAKVSGSSVDVVDIVAPYATGLTTQGMRIETDVPSGARINIHGGLISTVGAVDTTAFDIAGPATITCRDLKIALGTYSSAGSFGFYHRAAANCTLILDDCEMTQAGANSQDYSGSAGSIVRLRGRNNFNVTFKYLQTNTLGSSTADCGEFTLNGTTEVDVAGAFPIDATIELALKTVGSTPSESAGLGKPYFSQAQAAGHFYVKSPTVLCNDVYKWRAVGGGNG